MCAVQPHLMKAKRNPDVFRLTQFVYAWKSNRLATDNKGGRPRKEQEFLPHILMTQCKTIGNTSSRNHNIVIERGGIKIRALTYYPVSQISRVITVGAAEAAPNIATHTISPTKSYFCIHEAIISLKTSPCGLPVGPLRIFTS